MQVVAVKKTVQQMCKINILHTKKMLAMSRIEGESKKKQKCATVTLKQIHPYTPTTKLIPIMWLFPWNYIVLFHKKTLIPISIILL